MRKAFKYRIYLTKGQRRILEQQLEECRWLYNETLATRKNAWENEQRTVDWYETKRAIPLLKSVRPSLKAVHSQVLQNVTERVDLAFKAFFRRLKAGEEDAGYPRFKGFGRYDSITYPQYGNGVRLDGERLILSKIGAVQVVLHRPLDGTPKTVTLTRARSGKRKSIMDIAWSKFSRMTVSKAAEAGRRVILVDPRNTSKMCSYCGELVAKTLSDRTHSCPNCGLVMDRDRNAAINILQRGLQTLET